MAVCIILHSQADLNGARGIREPSPWYWRRDVHSFVLWMCDDKDKDQHIQRDIFLCFAMCGGCLVVTSTLANSPGNQSPLVIGTVIANAKIIMLMISSSEIDVELDDCLPLNPWLVPDSDDSIELGTKQIGEEHLARFTFFRSICHQSKWRDGGTYSW